MIPMRPGPVVGMPHEIICAGRPMEQRQPPSTRIRHALGIAVALAVMAVVAMVAAPVSRAQADAEALGLQAEAAIPGQAQAAWAPITVTISPAVPVEGTLELRNEGPNGTTTTRIAVEVTAGTTKQWTLLVPPGEGRPGVQLTSGDTVANATVAAFGASTALTGVLGDPEFADRVGAVTDRISGEVWTTVDIDAALLDLGPLALETIGTLTASQDAITALDDDQRNAVATAVNTQGLHLVVTEVTTDPQIGRPPGAADAADAAGIDVLPSAWSLAISDDQVTVGPATDAPAASITSGLGRVTWLTDGVSEQALASPRMWGELWTGTQLSTTFAWSRGAPIDPWALQQSGVRLPSSWAMMAFAGGYLLLIGLVALFVVRRLKRRELAWVVLPAMSLVLAAVAFAASSGNQASPGRSLAQATWIDGQGTQDMALLLPPELVSDVHLPGTGWVVESMTWDNPTVTVVSADGVALTTDSRQESFGVGVSMATRPNTSPAPVTIEAVVTEAGLRAEVSNTGDIGLTNVRLSGAGLDQVDVGSLPTGTTRVIELGPDGAVIDGESAPTTRAPWTPMPDSFGTAFGEDDFRAAEIRMEAGPGVEFGGGGFEGAANFAAASSRVVATQPAFVWVRALATDPIVDTPAGPGGADPDVVVVGVTPTVDPAASTSGARSVWQPTTGNVHELDNHGQMLFGDGTTWMSTAMPAAPAPGQLRIDVPRTESDDGCVDYDVFDDQVGQSRVEQLCDGEVLECPDDADSCELWDQGAYICTGDVCENWELRFDGNMAVEVWDRDQAAFRPWDDDFEAAVDGDPDLVMTPLGQVVVAINGNGEFQLARVDIGTGDGT